jgi:hypothetical protein
LWNYHFKEIDLYRSRKLWIPIIVIVLVYGIFISLHIFF